MLVRFVVQAWLRLKVCWLLVWTLSPLLSAGDKVRVDKIYIYRFVAYITCSGSTLEEDGYQGGITLLTDQHRPRKQYL